jgi:hypothetical protein
MQQLSLEHYSLVFQTQNTSIFLLILDFKKITRKNEKPTRFLTIHKAQKYTILSYK